MSRRILCCLLLLLLGMTKEARAYSVLTHEAIIDAAWDRSIVPILRARFHPSAAALRDARGYAYGGCLIQDVGYYPLAGVMFGQLAHYARTGDFVMTMLRESRTLEEEAFALGALAHYVSDVEGHEIAVNPSVPLTYPKLGAKFGPRMTYEDDPTAHLRTEFGFDVLQVARGSYRPQSYRDFIGFRISRSLLERAFQSTYGIPLDDVLPHYDLSIGTFRRAVSTIIPSMTKVAWAMKKDDIEKRFPGTTEEHFVFSLTRAEYETAWDGNYSRPNLLHKILAWVLRIIPKVGPFRILSFRPATQRTEQLFVTSFDRTVERYRARLDDVRNHRLQIENVNLDTGRPIRGGDYRLADETYAKWLEQLEHDRYSGITAAVRRDILAFYANPEAPIATKAHEHRWRDVTRDLAEIRERR